MVQNLGDDMESQKSSRHFDISISEQPDMQYASYSNEEQQFQVLKFQKL